MRERADPSRLTLVLTNCCNMSCSYCYERSGQPESMSWDTARSGADLALSMPGRVVELTFYGGEPLLEFGLIRRIVTYVEDSVSPGRQVRFWVVTNGTLIEREIADFLAEHEFTTQVSFDGVPEAQGLRGEGTFERLDRALDAMWESHPAYYSRRVEVSITVPPEALPFLSKSVDYFLRKGVRAIDLTPVITPDRGWRGDRVRELEEQFGFILESSLTHHERTGLVPLKLYSGEGLALDSPVASRAMCEIVGGNSWAVGPDGTVSGCVLFAPSIQGYDSNLLRGCRSTMVVGNVSDPDIASKMAAFTDKVVRLPIMSEKEKKYSSHRKCIDCRFFSVCVTCPASIGFIEGNSDPHRIPDYYCAFNYTALASRDGFPVQPTDIEVIRGDKHCDLREKWKKMGEAARSASSPKSLN